MIPVRLIPHRTDSPLRESVCHRDKKIGMAPTLSVLEVFKEHVETLALDTIVLDNDTRAAHDLAGIAFLVNLAKTCPCAQDLAVSDLDQVDFVLCAECFNEFDVLSLCAGLHKHTQVGLALVQCLGALAETTSETVTNKSVLQDLLRDQI